MKKEQELNIKRN